MVRVASARMNCESRSSTLRRLVLEPPIEISGGSYVMKARCALRRKAASCAKDVKVAFGLLRTLDSAGVVAEVGASAAAAAALRPAMEAESSFIGGHGVFNAAGFAGWKYR